MSSDYQLQHSIGAERLPFRIGIIGAGRVAGALVQAYEPCVAWVVARSPQRRAGIRQFVRSVPIIGTLREIVTFPEVILLAVSDRAIECVAAELVQQAGHMLEDRLVVHLSGAFTRQLLAPVERMGGKSAVAHPFTMVPEPHPAWLYGATWGIEAEQEVVSILNALVYAGGGVPFYLGARVTPERKALYHATAVLASNVVTAAIGTALECAHKAMIPPALFLPPILRATLESAVISLLNGALPPLTGPFARNDWTTIHAHLSALSGHQNLLRQYCLFALAILERAEGSAELRSSIEKLLEAMPMASQMHSTEVAA